MSGTHPFLKTTTPLRAIWPTYAKRGAVILLQPTRGIDAVEGRLCWFPEGVQVFEDARTVWVPYSNISLVIEDKES